MQKYLGLLRYVGRNVPYGAVEGRQLKHKSIGLVHRYGQMNCFFTLSPNNLANPRSIRLTCRTMNNTTFPADFESDCPFGENGVEFLEHLISDQSKILSEGTIHLPNALTTSQRAALAKDNPIAFVSENKRILFHILDILVGLKPETSGYYRKSSGASSRRSRYYSESKEKGILGHSLALIGVTEDHKRGHLHWHFTINGGISAYAMERFANLPELCEKISTALDQVYTSELDPDTHVATALRRFVNDNRKTWKVEQAAVDAVQTRDPMFVRPDKLAFAQSQELACHPCKLLCKELQEYGGVKQIHKYCVTCYNRGRG